MASGRHHARAQPNPGHIAIAQLQRTLNVTVVTQNVDDLHERAGLHAVLHLHGSMFAPRCAACDRSHMFAASTADQPLREITPPVCTHCGGWVRPGVVWFGESLDTRVFDKSAKLVAACDLLLVVGTSGVVYPAAGLVALAPRNALVIEINPENALAAGRIDHYLQTTAAKGLPAIAEYLQPDGADQSACNRATPP